MDQDKIGKLIAKLRKEKGLTQRELGDKVGVGFKAVSKWERGITCPDISIINELSKILGITSDELLTGKLNEEHKSINNKINNKFNNKIIVFIALIIVVGLSVLLIYKINNKMDIYELASNDNDNYYVEGKVIFKQKTMTIYINKLSLNDRDFCNTMVKNYKYRIDSGDNILLVYGFLLEVNELTSLISIDDIIKNLNINYEHTVDIDKNELIKNGLVLRMSFLGSGDEVLEKDIVLTLKKSK